MAIALASLWWVAPGKAQRDPTAVVRAAADETCRAALAIDESSDGETLATAFCIDPSGFFLTQYSDGRNDETFLRVSLGTSEERVVRARIVRADSKLGLRLLKVNVAREMAFIPLSPVLPNEAVSKLRAYSAFDHNSMSSRRPGESLIRYYEGQARWRREGGHVYSGYSGQISAVAGVPLVDEAGKCLCIYLRQNVSTAAFPLTELAAFFSKPEVAFTSLPIGADSIHKPHNFDIRLLTFSSVSPELKVDLNLRDLGGGERRYAAARVEANVWRAAGLPAANEETPSVIPYEIVVRSGERVQAEAAGNFLVEGLTPDALSAGNLRALQTGQPLSFPLPSPAARIAVGGGGRFLLVFSPDAGRLIIYDATRAAIVNDMPFPSDALIAAGATKFVVALPKAGQMQRWDLASLNKELTVTTPGDWVVRALGMGSASEGPVLVEATEKLKFVDLANLNVIRSADPKSSIFSSLDCVPSADGRTIGFVNPHALRGHKFQIVTTGVPGSSNAARTYDFVAAMPNADASYLFEDEGVFARSGATLVNTYGGKTILLPAVDHPGFSVQLDTPPIGEHGSGRLIRLPELTPLTDLPLIPELKEGASLKFKSRLPVQRRVFPLVNHRQLLIIPSGGDRLAVYPLNLGERLAGTGEHVVIVTSVPPVSTERDKASTYQIIARGNGNLTYELLAGPSGTTVSSEGKVQWRLPSNYPERRASIVVSIHGEGGQEITHSLVMEVK